MAELKEDQVIDNGFIWKMLRHPLWLQSFPFLKTYAAALASVSSCGGCSRKAGLGPDLNAIKQIIGSLPPDLQVEARRLAKAKKITVYWRNPQGKPVSTTF